MTAGIGGAVYHHMSSSRSHSSSGGGRGRGASHKSSSHHSSSSSQRGGGRQGPDFSYMDEIKARKAWRASREETIASFEELERRNTQELAKEALSFSYGPAITEGEYLHTARSLEGTIETEEVKMLSESKTANQERYHNIKVTNTSEGILFADNRYTRYGELDDVELAGLVKGFSGKIAWIAYVLDRTEDKLFREYKPRFNAVVKTKENEFYYADYGDQFGKIKQSGKINLKELRFFKFGGKTLPKRRLAHPYNTLTTAYCICPSELTPPVALAFQKAMQLENTREEVGN